MKRLMIALGLVAASVAPASALPGQTYQELDRWVKGHKFLTPWLIGDTGAKYNADSSVMAFRQLEDNWFIDISMEYSCLSKVFTDPYGSPPLKNPKMDRKHCFEELFLNKKTYAKSAGNEMDPRPWETTAYKDIWSRDNSSAYDLLKNIYGKDVAEDYKSSSMVYDGSVYLVKNFGWGNSALHPQRENIKDARELSMTHVSSTQMFKGNKYYYQAIRSDNNSTEVVINPSLIVMHTADGIERTSILNHNAKIFEQYSGYRQNTLDRAEPARIKIE